MIRECRTTHREQCSWWGKWDPLFCPIFFSSSFLFGSFFLPSARGEKKKKTLMKTLCHLPIGLGPQNSVASESQSELCTVRAGGKKMGVVGVALSSPFRTDEGGSPCPLAALKTKHCFCQPASQPAQPSPANKQASKQAKPFRRPADP